MTPINILMTGGGAPGAAGILRCLQFDPRLEITMADANPDAIGRWIHAEFENIPWANDPAFIDALLAICKKRKIDLLMPLVTRELIPLAEHADKFLSIGTRLIISKVESLRIANDKGKLYQFLEWRGIETPPFRIVNEALAFEQAMQDLGYPAKTICFKPCIANGGRGFRIITDKISQIDLLFNEKPDSVHISLIDALRILSKGSFPELLVSEFLPGDEYSVDCLANQGKAVLIAPRLRKKTLSGISVEGEFVKETSIIDYCARIIKELELHGNIGIQLRLSAEGKFLILEINPRVQGTISAGLGAGINLPLLAVKQELGLPIISEELEIKWGTRFSRYWNEVFY
jgi:carbamoyl-phosphate synthase large subunit